MTNTPNKSRFTLHTPHFLQKATNTRHTLVRVFASLLIFAGGREVEGLLSPSSLPWVTWVLCWCRWQKEENAWPLSLVSNAGCRTDVVSLVSQSHGLFCLLPCMTVICVLSISTFLLISSLRTETMSYFLEHLVCTNYLLNNWRVIY